MGSLRVQLVVVFMAAVIAMGASLFYVAYYGGVNAAALPTASITTVQSAQEGVATPGTVQPYDCPLPAISSQYSCDVLPTGYQIPPHLPNAPAPYCLSNMTASACNLLKQTEGSGVCTPNETPWTAPLDCTCTGALVPDPYQGRCAAPATVCQLQLQQEAAKAAGQG